jgi:5-methylcytosine-specific restriction enzyme A
MVYTKQSHKWQREDLILTLDFYFKNYQERLTAKSASIIELSKYINALPVNRHNNPLTPNSVYLKLVNYMSLDKRIEGKGLGNVTNKDILIWNEFYNNQQQLETLSISITSYIFEEPENISIEIESDNLSFSAYEGKLLSSIHLKRERNRSLVEKKKKQQLLIYGSLECEVCGFNFEREYGERGKGFIECHHIKPIATLEKDSITILQDLALLCSNCHRMIHSKQPWLTISELKTLASSSKL